MTKYYGLFPHVLILVCWLPISQTKADFHVLNHSYWISFIKNVFRPDASIYLLPLVCCYRNGLKNIPYFTYRTGRNLN